MSRQDYGTPWEFIRAVEAKWGPIVCDLAAHAGNAKAPLYYDESRNSLSVSWAREHPTGNLWLNPPFSHIEPWAESAAYAATRRDGLILMLTPASIGTDWFRHRVHGNARVLGISPRITFEGAKDPYPKDLMLSIFGKATGGFDVWRWRP